MHSQTLTLKADKIVAALCLAVVLVWFTNGGLTGDFLHRKANHAQAAVRLGMSMAEVRAVVGSPDKTQDMRNEYSDSAFWYYGDTQIGFESDRVTSINRY